MQEDPKFPMGSSKGKNKINYRYWANIWHEHGKWESRHWNGQGSEVVQHHAKLVTAIILRIGPDALRQRGVPGEDGGKFLALTLFRVQPNHSRNLCSHDWKFTLAPFLRYSLDKPVL